MKSYLSVLLLIVFMMSVLAACNVDDGIISVAGSEPVAVLVPPIQVEFLQIANDAIEQELLEIITASKKFPLTEEEIMNFMLTSFRGPYNFIIDDIKYSFETQMRLLIVFDDEGFPSEYYHASEFERAIEIHNQHTE